MDVKKREGRVLLGGPFPLGLKKGLYA